MTGHNNRKTTYPTKPPTEPGAPADQKQKHIKNLQANLNVKKHAYEAKKRAQLAVQNSNLAAQQHESSSSSNLASSSSANHASSSV